MKRRRGALAALSVAAATAMLLTACTGGSKSTTNPSGGSGGAAPAFNAAVAGIVSPSAKTGGTLNLIASTDCDSWDPARTYYGWCWNMQRLFTRSLVGFSQVNGTTPKITGDLATGLGKHNADFTQWTYTMKPGLKFSTGKAITPQDVKYGVERLFATDVINGGPAGYFLGSIDHPKNYAGPYKSGDLDSITTTSDSITFKLSSSYADFDYLMALPASAPVPYKTEGGSGFTGANYGKMPVSSGPFVITSYTQNKSVSFARNKYWTQSSDSIRKPKVNSIQLTIDSDVNDIDNKLATGAADAKADNDIGTTLQQKVLTQPKLKPYADNPQTPLTRYLTVAPSVKPFDNVHCRRAVQYAVNKAAVISAFGGAVYGVPAGSMTPITIPGHSDSANPYPGGKNATGDVAKAKQELTACGQPNGFTTKFAYSTPSETGPKVFQAVKTALARVGITVTASTAAASSYYTSFLGSPRNVKAQGLGIGLAGWGADFPTGYGFWNNIANGSAILQTGNSNYPSLNDSTVNGILDSSLKGQSTDADFAKLDTQVMSDAVYVPLLFGKGLYYRNPRLTNVTADNALAFGIYDFVQVGVSK